jgi:NAD(P)-dependent dehydrogenase (short-subunit alcohol dehydrogenase family)
MGSLEGKVAIVTGGTSGIGAACAELFVAEGALVVIAARRLEEGEALVAKLGDAASYVRTDVSREDDVRALVASTVARHGRLDCLVNNAGHSNGVQSISAVDAAQFDALFAVHLRGTLLGMKYASPVMLRQRSGSIVNVASIAAHLPGIAGHTYAALKAAIVQLTRSVALELGEGGVRVNSVSPGAIVTGIFGKAAGMTESQAACTFETLAARFATFQSIPRAGMPRDVADVVAWLASDRAAFVNGADIKIDGAIPGGLSWARQSEMRAGLSKSG